MTPADLTAQMQRIQAEMDRLGRATQAAMPQMPALAQTHARVTDALMTALGDVPAQVRALNEQVHTAAAQAQRTVAEARRLAGLQSQGFAAITAHLADVIARQMPIMRRAIAQAYRARWTGLLRRTQQAALRYVAPRSAQPERARRRGLAVFMRWRKQATGPPAIQAQVIASLTRASHGPPSRVLNRTKVPATVT